MAHDVFISYSSEDKTVADAVCATLEGRKIRCWIAPRDVTPGQAFAASLINAVKSSRVMVLVLSEDSNKSQYVLRELNEAVDKGIPIIPFRIEDVDPSEELRFYIKSLHWLDAMDPPLERHLKRLADSVQALLSVGEEDQPPETETFVVASPQKRRSLSAWALALIILAAVIVLGIVGLWVVPKLNLAPPSPTSTTISVVADPTDIPYSATNIPSLTSTAVWVAVDPTDTPSTNTPTLYFDMVIDETRELIYGSNRSGGEIHIISMNTLDIISTLSVGSEPSGVDISPDDAELAVALYGQSEIAFIDLDTLMVTARVNPAVAYGPNRPYDLLYGRPGRLYSVGNPDTSGFDYVHVFDTDSHTELGCSNEIMRAAPRLAMTADHNFLYVSQVTFTPNKIYRFDITSDNPVQIAAAPHGPVRVNTLAVKPDGSKVYSSRGQIWSNDLSTMLGSFSPSGEEIEYSEILNRFYISAADQVVEFDAGIYSPKRFIQLEGTAGVARINSTGMILYVSTSVGISAINVQEANSYMPCIPQSYCFQGY
jgi:DNA-binding beta-propeller fold protein YncE